MRGRPAASDQPRGTPQTHVGNVTPAWPGRSRGHHSRARAWTRARDTRRAAPAPSRPSLPAVTFPLRPSACDARSRSLLPRFTRTQLVVGSHMPHGEATPVGIHAESPVGPAPRAVLTMKKHAKTCKKVAPMERVSVPSLLIFPTFASKNARGASDTEHPQPHHSPIWAATTHHFRSAYWC